MSGKTARRARKAAKKAKFSAKVWGALADMPEFTHEDCVNLLARNGWSVKDAEMASVAMMVEAERLADLTVKELF